MKSGLMQTDTTSGFGQPRFMSETQAKRVETERHASSDNHMSG